MLKSLAAELLDWLTMGLTGARAKGKCGNVAKGGGMWFRNPLLQFNFAYSEELHQGAILSGALLTTMEKICVDFKTKWMQTL